MENKEFPLAKENYKLILIGLAVIVLGFILMAGGGSEDPNVFLEEELFSFRRITLAPALVIGGYIFIVYAIMKKPKATKK
ncbi:MAG: DUF3098 domain-containing protein [Bacteroidia bacterium]